MIHDFTRALLLTVLLTNLATAGAPVLKSLHPYGARRGNPVVIRIEGERLAEAELFGALPAATEVLRSDSKNVSLKLQFLPNAPVGIYPIRLRTPGGLSNPLLFSLGDFPEVLETEPNDDLSADHPFSLPVTVNGEAPASDQDFYAIACKAGEAITVEVEASRLGSQLDPVVRVLDAEGRELAINDDAPGLGADSRCHLVVPEDGIYHVVVHDVKFDPGTPNFYRLKIGHYGYAEGIFPLGWQRGATVPVQFVGGTLNDTPAARAQTMLPGWLEWTTVGVPSGSGRAGTLPFRFAVGNDPEIFEPEAGGICELAPETVVNGRLSEPGQVDRYKLTVKPGEKWRFEVDAAMLGSPLDAVLTVTDPSGKQLAAGDDESGLDPRVTFDVPAETTEIVLQLEDLIGRGGPTYAYRLRATQPKPGFALEVVPTALNIPRGGTANVTVQAQREQYDGPIQLSLPEHSEGLSASGGLIPAGQSEGVLAISAASDAPLGVFDLALWGQGGPATKPMRRPATGNTAFPAAQTPGGHYLNIPAAVTEPLPVAFESEPRLQLVQGHSAELKITANRSGGATEAIAISGVALPNQVSGGTGSIAKDAAEGIVKLDVSNNAPLGSSTLLLAGKINVGGVEETIPLKPIHAEVVRPFSLEILTQPVIISVGAKSKLVGVLRRNAPFAGEVTVAPDVGLPAGVTCASQALDPGAAVVELELVADATAQPGEYEFKLKGTTELNGTYILRDINVPVKVVAASKEHGSPETAANE